MEAKVRLDHELLAVETEHAVHLILELTAPPALSDRPRPSLHLALVVDRSGSMEGRKMEVIRECGAFLARRLAATGQPALVTFDDVVDLVVPLAPVGDGQALRSAIRGIEARGSTNLSGGWLRGMESLRAEPAGEPRKILLLTDGLPTRASSSRARSSRRLAGRPRSASARRPSGSARTSPRSCSRPWPTRGGATPTSRQPRTTRSSPRSSRGWSAWWPRT